MFDASPAELHVEFLSLERCMVSPGQLINDHEADIVTGTAILLTRIAQPGD